ncbi:Pentatricopeptide repeat-containing protein [Drosera capensis]
MYQKSLMNQCHCLNDALTTITSPSFHHYATASTTREAPMSKKILSLIKPHKTLNPKPYKNPNFTCKPNLRPLADKAILILTTQTHFDQTLETLLSQHSITGSQIAHLVFDRIRDALLGIKFYDWVTNRKYCESLDGYGFSSFLRLLCRNRLVGEIGNVLEEMRKDGIFPTRDAVGFVIRVYSGCGMVDEGLRVYRFVVDECPFMPDVYACNALLDALVKRGRVVDARKVYDEMMEKNGEGDDDEDYRCLDNYSTCIVVRGLCMEGKVEEGRKLIEDRWGRGCVPNVVFYNTLVHGYCKRGDVASANVLFDELKMKGVLPTVETYGALIGGFCKKGKFERVNKLLAEMKARGVMVNVQIYNNVIDARYKHGCTVEPIEMMQEMKENGCRPDVVTYNTLISGLCSSGRVDDAHQLLKLGMKRGLMPDKYSYTPLLQCYLKNGEIEIAYQVLSEMSEKGQRLDIVTFGTLAHGLMDLGEVEAALRVPKMMMAKGFLPDAGIYNVLLGGLCKKGRLFAAKELIGEMLAHDIALNAPVCTTMIDGLVRNGSLDEAKRLFELSLEKDIALDVVAYNAMIKGYCKFGMMKDAVSCIKKMVDAKLAPDEFTYSTMIDGYVKQQDLDGAAQMFRQMEIKKCKPNVVTYTSLINGFCHKGDSAGAEKLFREMPSRGLKPNVVTCSVIIGIFCKEGKLEKAVSIFEEMLITKCTPNDFTFNHLVRGIVNNITAATSKRENVGQSLMLFFDLLKRMISDGWSPTTAAYNCIIVFLCRYGMFVSALHLSKNMTRKGCQPDSVTFAGLLYGLCLEGRLSEWYKIIPCNLNEQELQVAVTYSLLLESYFPPGMSSTASSILLGLVEDCKSHRHEEDNVDALFVLQPKLSFTNKLVQISHPENEFCSC